MLKGYRDKFPFAVDKGHQCVGVGHESFQGVV